MTPDLTPRIPHIVAQARGTGVLFGPDVAQRFLERSSLSLIVRSHEQVLEGFDWPYGDQQHLVTVFSASNYANRTRNKGAFMVIGARGDAEPLPPLPTWLGGGHTCTDFDMGFGRCRLVQWEPRDLAASRAAIWAHYRLRSAVAARAPQLRAAYADADAPSTGRLPLALWEATTLSVVGDDVGAASGGEGAPPPRALLTAAEAGQSTVDYSAFLERYAASAPALDAMAPAADYLLALLYRADAAGSGDVDAATFRAACRALHAHVGDAAAPCADADALLGALGAAGEGARRGGRVAISAVADALRPPAGAEGGTAAERATAALLHRLDLHDIAAAGAGEEREPRKSEMVIAEDDSDEEAKGRPSGMDVDGERSSSLRESSSSEPPSLGLTRGAPIGVPRGNRGSLPIGGSHAIAMERARSGDEPEDMRD